MQQTLEQLREEYEALTSKKPHHKLSAESLTAEIEKIKAGEKAPPLVVGESSSFIKGNMTHNLNEDNPFKDYQFEDEIIIPKSSRMKEPITAKSYFHVGFVPAIEETKGYKQPLPKHNVTGAPKMAQKPFVSVLSLNEFQVSRPKYEKASNLIFHVLHDPTRK